MVASQVASKLMVALLLYLLRYLIYWQGSPSFDEEPFFGFCFLSCYIRTNGQLFVHTRKHTHVHNLPHSIIGQKQMIALWILD